MTINKGDMVYWARIIPSHHIYDVYDLKVRTVTNDYFVGCDNIRAYSFGFNQIGKLIFTNRDDAVALVLEEQMKDDMEVGDKFYEDC